MRCCVDCPGMLYEFVSVLFAVVFEGLEDLFFGVVALAVVAVWLAGSTGCSAIARRSSSFLTLALVCHSNSSI